MGRETNIHSIRVLEKQIEEGKGDTIKLKRARNSLLNISTRAPPEILGEIFAWSLVREAGRSLYSQHFDGLGKGSHNFLLVCHHWYEVASRTPELWSFWGNTLQDWRKRHHLSGAAPLDLVLDGGRCDPKDLFDESLQAAVKGRVIQGTIQQVHLKSDDRDILSSIIASLAPDDDSARIANIESIVWENRGLPLDISEFLARSRLPKLRLLALDGDFLISSWKHLASGTTLLTALSLDVSECTPSGSITVPHLFSILTSNPNLQQLVLSSAAIPNDTDESTFQVPLRNLKLLSLTGDFRRVIRLLCRLALPETLDAMHLTGFDLTIEDISQFLRPYMQDHFRHDARFQERLEISSYSSFASVSVSINVAYAQTTAPTRMSPVATFTAVIPPADIAEQLFIDLIAFIPQERIVSFGTVLQHRRLPKEIFYAMPNIEILHLSDVGVSGGFLQPNPEGPYANTKFLPSLRSLYLENFTLDDNDWGHLTTYLAHQTSDDQTLSLDISGYSPYMPEEVVKEIMGLVEEFAYNRDPEADSGRSAWNDDYSTDEEDE